MMSKNRSTTWVDITELVRWKGPVTGVQRVIYKLSQRYQSQSNAKFVVFDNTLNSFVEINFEEAMAQREQPATAPAQELSSDAELQAMRRIKSLVKKVHRRAKQRMPQSYARLASGVKARLDAGRHKQNLPSDLQTKSVHIGHEDTLLLLAGSWDNDLFIAYIVSLRRKVHPTIIHIVCDMIPIVAPNFSHEGIRRVFKNYMLKILPCVDGIAAISEAAKRDVEKVFSEYGLKKVPITVIRLGDDIMLTKHPKRPESAKGLQKDAYILYVSTIEVRKNHALLYYAAKAAAAKGIAIPKIVIAGKVGWLANDVYEVMQTDPGVKDKFVFLHGLDDESISWLYQNCRMGIMSSWYEGWGLPVAEALCYGKVAIASNTSSLPEVGGKLLDYFAPYDPMSCLKLLEKYNDDKVLAKKTEEIRKHYKMVSWDETFAQFDTFVKSF
jgi:hypothetical protein